MSTRSRHPVGEETLGDPEPGKAKPRLLSFRLLGLLDTLRRSGILASRREYGLTGIEWRIMVQVGAHAPLSLNDLAELLSLDRGQVSRSVKGMAGRGLLDSRRLPGGPAITITLTEDGKELHVRMMASARERNAFLVSDIPAEEVELAVAVFDKVLQRAQLLLDQERAASGGAGREAD